MAKALKQLQDLHFEAQKTKYKTIPPAYIPRKKFADATANGLTQCIIQYINLMGGFAERISNTGRQIDNRKIVTDVLGQKRILGTVSYIKGTGKNGTADISATYKGLSLKIEVKIGKDKMSAAQSEYKQKTEGAGGIYYIAKDFETFFEWFNQLKSGGMP